MWKSERFDGLNTTELYECLRLRSEVFVVEQDCVYQDLDRIDLKSIHLFQWTPEMGVSTYARIIPPGELYEEVSIGRVVVGKPFRNKGLGRTLMNKAIQECLEKYPSHPIRIMAQSYLIDFYKSLSFVVVSEDFLEDGIPHVYMVRSIT